MDFFIGMCNPSDAWPFRRVMVSINRLKDRRSGFRVNQWMLDSGAFTALDRPPHRYRDDPERYADQVTRWAGNGGLLAACTQDYMCEPSIRAKTGLTVEQHQVLTIERYLRIQAATPVFILPVVQGHRPGDYARHLALWDGLLKPGTWAGVGSVCKRKNVEEIEDVLSAVHSVRPDLKLHGFGLKLEALESPTVRRLLHSSDSMAWSFAARREDRDANDPREALAYAARVERATGLPSFIQQQLFNAWN